MLAQLTSISSHQGGSQGQVLSVKGTGFTSDISNYDCQVAGENCTITEASLTSLTVEIPPVSDNSTFDKLSQSAGDTSIQVNPYLGSNGAIYKRYDRESMSLSTSDWLTHLNGNPSNNVQSSRIITELSSPEIYGEDYVEHVKGYFYAPVDG